jgi:hypothetical protein
MTDVRAVTTPPGSRDERGHIFGTRLVCIRCGAVIDSDEAAKSTCATPERYAIEPTWEDAP